MGSNEEERRDRKEHPNTWEKRIYEDWNRWGEQILTATREQKKEHGEQSKGRRERGTKRKPWTREGKGTVKIGQKKVQQGELQCAPRIKIGNCELIISVHDETEDEKKEKIKDGWGKDRTSICWRELRSLLSSVSALPPICSSLSFLCLWSQPSTPFASVSIFCSPDCLNADWRSKHTKARYLSREREREWRKERKRDKKERKEEGECSEMGKMKTWKRGNCFEIWKEKEKTQREELKERKRQKEIEIERKRNGRMDGRQRETKKRENTKRKDRREGSDKQFRSEEEREAKQTETQRKKEEWMQPGREERKTLRQKEEEKKRERENRERKEKRTEWPAVSQEFELSNSDSPKLGKLFWKCADCLTILEFLFHTRALSALSMRSLAFLVLYVCFLLSDLVVVVSGDRPFAPHEYQAFWDKWKSDHGKSGIPWLSIHLSHHSLFCILFVLSFFPCCRLLFCLSKSSIHHTIDHKQPEENKSYWETSLR